MKKLVVSGALTIVQKHMKFTRSLFENISKINPPFDELVVVASGIKSRDYRRLQKVATGVCPKVVFVSVPLLPLGVNRNLGWLQSRGDIVCFLDSDDLYSPLYRTEIERMFAETGAQVVLHGYVPVNQRNPKSSEFPTIPLVEVAPTPLSNRDLVPINLLGPNRDREAELKRDGSLSRLLLPRDWGHEVHQGHASVIRSLIKEVSFIQEIGQRNEDGVFIKDCLDLNLPVAIYAEPLSAYSLRTSAIYWNVARIGKIARKLYQMPLVALKKILS